MLIDIRPRLLKPAVGAMQIDRGHPLARDLRFYVLLNEGAGNSPRRLDTEALPTTVSGTSILWRLQAKAGLEAKVGTDTAARYATPTSRDAFLPPITVFAGLRWTGTTNAVIAENNGNNGWSFATGDTTAGLGRILLHTAGSPNNVLNSNNTTLNNGLPHVIVMRFGYPTTDQAVYMDGQDVTSVKQTTNVAQSTATVTDLFSRNGTVGFGENIYFFGYSQRLWSQAEALWLFSEPYAFLQPIPRVRYWSTPAAVAAAGSVVSPRSLSLLGVGA